MLRNTRLCRTRRNEDADSRPRRKPKPRRKCSTDVGRTMIPHNEIPSAESCRNIASRQSAKRRPHIPLRELHDPLTRRPNAEDDEQNVPTRSNELRESTSRRSKIGNAVESREVRERAVQQRLTGHCPLARKR